MSRSKLYTGAAFAFIVAIMLVVAGITYLNLQRIENYTRYNSEESIPQELTTDAIEINILKTQELLTDTALTGQPNGFALAEEAASQVINGLKESTAAARKANETAVLEELKSIEKTFQTFYKTGKDMATFYQQGETEKGHKSMLEFDARGEDLLARYESIRDLQVNKEKADTARILSTVHQAKVLLLSTCLIAICASFIAALTALSIK